MDKKQLLSQSVLMVFLLLIFTSCSSDTEPQKEEDSATSLQEVSDRITVIDEGLAGPEAVRYDPDQDVYFVSNFNGSSSEADSNGYIAKARPDGSIDSLKFMTGTEEAPFHSPRGMYITGDTLFVADLKGVHGFNKQTGEQVAFYDFTDFEPGFLNDVAVDTNGVIYVTDTGQARVYQIKGSDISIVADSLAHPPNGITLDESNNQLVIAPWNSGQIFRSFSPSDSTLQDFITVGSGGNFDGIEPYNGSFLVSSQNDSSLYLISNSEESKALIKTGPEPADIALDTKRDQVAIPYIELDRVDIWQLNTEDQ
jgi:hypothetical protein